MRKKKLLAILVLTIFILSLGILILNLNTKKDTRDTDNGGYIVGPCISDEELKKLGDRVDMSGADETLTFWGFPFSIKIACIMGYLITFISVFKLLPLILGQIKYQSKYKKRDKILNYVKNNPGSTPSEISKELNISLGAVRYQLKALKAEEELLLLLYPLLLFLRINSRLLKLKKS